MKLKKSLSMYYLNLSKSFDKCTASLEGAL